MSQRNSALNVVLGVLAILLCHILVLGVLLLMTLAIPTSEASGFLILFTFGIGITQIVYVIPLVVWLRTRQRYDTMKDALIGAALTLLLNGGCFVLFWSSF